MAEDIMGTIEDRRNVQCWNEIGVNGDHSCPSLEEMSHCRNCPEYTAYGKTLLDRDIPKELLKERTRLLSRKKTSEAPGVDTVVIFRIGEEWLALKIGLFREIVELCPIHTVPFRSNEKFIGLVNISGELVPCVSIRNVIGIARKDLPYAEISSGWMAVVGNSQGERFVFRADEISGVSRLSADELKESPATIAHSDFGLTKGVFTRGEKTIGLLDEDRFFDSLQESISR
ncbi:MAG: chemotaxis protein CheW [Candidatus Latescibacteria bacterium]|nr:chemotaxis protein CheW [Candidatus Latescibacterota bacterium]